MGKEGWEDMPNFENVTGLSMLSTEAKYILVAIVSLHSFPTENAILVSCDSIPSCLTNKGYDALKSKKWTFDIFRDGTLVSVWWIWWCCAFFVSGNSKYLNNNFLFFTEVIFLNVSRFRNTPLKQKRCDSMGNCPLSSNAASNPSCRFSTFVYFQKPRFNLRLYL